MNETEMKQAIQIMRIDSAVKNKKGIAFIAASIFVWIGVFIINLLPAATEKRNLYTWFAVAFLLPIALVLTKLLKIQFNNKENPLNQLGIIITMNEVLYILIACWVHSAVPEKMIMVLAMIFGAHLLPFGWLYQSKAYLISSVIVTVGIFIIGCMFPAWVVALCMVFYELLLTILLYFENKELRKYHDC